MFVIFLDLKKLLKYVQQLRFHLVLDFVSISRQLYMATYFRQLSYLLCKNAIFKYHCKSQAICEVAIALLTVAILVSLWAIHPTYDTIPSSKQVIYNAGEIPGGKRQHLAYVTNVNASEIQFFLRFYSLLYLFDKDVNPMGKYDKSTVQKNTTSLMDNFVVCTVKTPGNSSD